MKRTNVLLCDFVKIGSNGIVYNEKEFKDAIDRYIKNNEGSSIIYGGMNPSYNSIYTPLGSITHKADLSKLVYKDNKVYCDIDINDTPNGKLVQEMIDNGVHLKFEPRIFGEFSYRKDKNGNTDNIVADIKNFNIVSVDIIM